MIRRKVTAIWNGNGSDGNGFLTAQSGAFNNMPYSFKTRFENNDGKLGTNPEELIAAALAGCFNMKLAFILNEAKIKPEELCTNAILTFQDGAVTSITLKLRGMVDDLDESKFEKFAEEAKNTCPISGVLNCQIILNSSLT